MVEVVNIVVGKTQLSLAPELGGAIAGLACQNKAILRPWNGVDCKDPFTLASNILVPFSNRISGGGFVWDEVFYEIEPNLNDEACPIHGDGFQRSWEVKQKTLDSVTLQLNNGHIGPFIYRAEQLFRLQEDSLKINFKLINLGSEALPFGFGFHPWFPRNKQTKLQFEASHVWLEDEQYLPKELIKVSNGSHWDYSSAKMLPAQWLNNAWLGWQGEAKITQGSAFKSVTISASSNLNCAIVHSVDENSDFFCFEPVSHAVDAHNLPNLPGLKILKPGQSINADIKYLWEL